MADNNVESKKIILPERVTIGRRVSEVKKHISEWKKNLKNNFDDDMDEVRLSKYYREGDKVVYLYTIAREVRSLKRHL